MKVNVNLLTAQTPNIGYDHVKYKKCVSPLIRVNTHDKNVNLHVCIEICFGMPPILPSVNVGIQCTNLHRDRPEIPTAK